MNSLYPLCSFKQDPYPKINHIKVIFHSQSKEERWMISSSAIVWSYEKDCAGLRYGSCLTRGSVNAFTISPRVQLSNVRARYGALAYI